MQKAIHFNTLKFCIDFFREVTTYADFNQMNTYNIAVTVGPNIFRTKDHKSEDIIYSGIFTEILMSMMKEFGYLFEDASRVDDEYIVCGEVSTHGDLTQEILGDKNIVGLARTRTISDALGIHTV